MRTVAVAAGVLAGVAAVASALTKDEAVAAGVKYFSGRCAEQQVLLDSLATALATGDMAASRAAYIASRPPYEEIEVLGMFACASAWGEWGERNFTAAVD